MNPIEFDEQTGSLGPPPGISDEDCGRLPYMKGVKDGMMTFTSLWKPTPEELADLNEGKAVQLTLYSNRHPMVSIGVSE